MFLKFMIIIIYNIFLEFKNSRTTEHKIAGFEPLKRASEQFFVTMDILVLSIP